MSRISVSDAWSESAAFLRREARLVLPVAFLLVALPQALVQSLSGGAVPGQPQAEPSVVGGLLMLPMMSVTLIGTIALCALALRPGLSVGEAIRVGGRRFLPLLGALLLAALGLALLFLPIFVVIGFSAARGATGAGAVVAVLLLIAAGVTIGVRLLLTTPVAAVEPGGPIAILKRSWSLTGPVFWKLLGLLLLVLLAMLVVMMAVGAVFGLLVILVAGPPQPGGGFGSFLILLVTAVIQALVTAFMMTLFSRVYAQLVGGGPDDMEGIFG
ncbi:MAG: hypothetical protein ACK4K7_11170 [Allosphingosinicella sp.]|uniref:hypothetical protein n=1 Tax=Allosphingosinicella sp. TaxID=2823234 RepID=UPI00393D15DA